MSLSCQRVVELLPLLLSGSLEERERRSVRDHLAACERCRGELEETAEAWQLFAQHIPSLALAEYGLGLPASDLDAERIERHLALCPSCRRELEWVRSSEVADFETARKAKTAAAPRRRAAGTEARLVRWRRLAVAAGLAAMVASGGLIWSLVGRGFVAPDPVVGSVAERDAGRALSAAGPRGEPSRETGNGLFVDGFESGRVGAWSSVSR